MKTGENRCWLHHSDSVVLLGSCFSDNMGGKLHGALINATVNPMGTLYNPMSIARGVQRLIDNEPVAGKDLFMQSGVWNSYDFHSRYSLPDKQATLDRMNQRILQGHDALDFLRGVISEYFFQKTHVVTSKFAPALVIKRALW